MSRKAKAKRRSRTLKKAKYPKKAKKAKNAKKVVRRSRPHSRRRSKAAEKRQHRKPRRQRLRKDPLLEAAVLEMNRGRSLTATTKSVRVPSKQLKAYLRQHRIAKRKGKRIVARDNRLRRVPVMTDGRVRVVTVRGYEQARLVGQHHNAVANFVQTNDIGLIEPFKGKSVQSAKGKEHTLETDANALHRIAAMDTPPFHEIYKITSTN